eukprot:CAMPEP_0194069954 /NCGR_PEP_ID=MMETSP0009_2-20130614/87917_1 /TAXON_ID=210454 /ORGANISM="Grammatophora oceanica, Strain CCMP 410" /LENGTH=389 /DNA_ID=CAMNT_0038723181 /DNA_START=622 /DNA_END=1791 /DNA_ORIENTATION=+
MLARRSSSLLRRSASRALSTQTVLPRVVERRANEAGPGGRASNADLKVAIFGATGFLGRYVCSELGANGVLAYIANRGDEMEARHLKVCFDLGRTRFVFYSPRDRESVEDVIADADIVVNLIGKYHETGQPVETKSFPYIGYQTNYSFADANIEVPSMIAQVCKDLQVDNLIHVSSAAASPDASSEWARTKYLGEEAVKEIYPWATIIRPTQYFGYEDRFMNWFANAATFLPMVPMIDGGEALTQPVHVVNVAETIVRVCDSPETFEGKQIDCFGPADYTYKELAEFAYDITGQGPKVVDLPKSTVKQFAQAAQWTRNPLLTPDMVELWSEDYLPTYATQEEYSKMPTKDRIYTMADLGVKATPLEKEAFNYLHRFRTGGHFILTDGYH